MVGYWTGKQQPDEMIKKRADSMRGQKRRPYAPRTEEAVKNHKAAMELIKQEPAQPCPNNCGRAIKRSGMTRHRLVCDTWSCSIIECENTLIGARGLCTNHYAVYKGAKKFGLTSEEYIKMYMVRDCLCDICGKKCVPRGGEAARVGRDNCLCIDHDHSTGKIREMLCHSCNVALGSFKDSTKNLQAAIEYLNKNV